MTNRKETLEATLRKQLGYFGANALKQVTRTLQVNAAGGDHARQVEALAPFIGSARHRAVLERHLTTADWQLLTLPPVRAGRFRLRAMLSTLRERGTPAEAALAAVAKLLQHGCLLPADAPAGAPRLNIDANGLTQSTTYAAWFGLAPAVGDWAREHVPARALALVEPPSVLVPAALPELQRAVFVVLTETSNRPLRLTAVGHPYKADMSRLAKALAGTAGRGAPKGSTEAPAVLWFATGALMGAGVLDLQGSDLVVAGQPGDFLGLPVLDQVKRLLEGWLVGPFDDFVRIPTLETYYYPSSMSTPWVAMDDDAAEDVEADSFAGARRMIQEALREGTAGAPGGWYRIDDLATGIFEQFPEILFERWSDYELTYPGRYGYSAESSRRQRSYAGVYRKMLSPAGSQEIKLRELSIDADWLEVEGAFVRQVVAEPLRWLGLVEVGPTAEIPDRFRLTDLGLQVLADRPVSAPATAAAATAGRAVVQPNFEVVVVDTAASLGLMVQLDEFAERRSLDRAATYRLTQAALVRGLDRGWTGERILAVLEQASDRALPQNVRYSLEEWVRLYERVWLREGASLLEADTPDQLDAWLADATLAPLLGRRLSPTAVLVLARNTLALGQHLRRLGVDCATVDYAQAPAGVLHLRNPDLIEVPRETLEPYLQYRLEAFSVPADGTAERVRYRVTQESMQRATAMGLSGPQLAEFLAEAAGRPLAPDVACRILGWSGAVPALVAEPLVTIVIPEQPVSAALLQQIPAIAKLIRGLPTPTLALVAPADVPALRVELERRGISLAEQAVPAEALQSRTAPARPADLLLQAMLDPMETLKRLTPDDVAMLEDGLRLLQSSSRKERSHH